jgi:hypothetical protein
MNAEFFLLRGNLDTYDPTVPDGYKERYGDLQSIWQEHNKAYHKLMEEDVNEFNELYRTKSLPGLVVPESNKKEG